MLRAQRILPGVSNRSRCCPQSIEVHQDHIYTVARNDTAIVVAHHLTNGTRWVYNVDQSREICVHDGSVVVLCQDGGIWRLSPPPNWDKTTSPGWVGASMIARLPDGHRWRYITSCGGTVVCCVSRQRLTTAKLVRLDTATGAMVSLESPSLPMGLAFWQNRLLVLTCSGLQLEEISLETGKHLSTHAKVETHTRMHMPRGFGRVLIVARKHNLMVKVGDGDWSEVVVSGLLQDTCHMSCSFTVSDGLLYIQSADRFGQMIKVTPRCLDFSSRLVYRTAILPHLAVTRQRDLHFWSRAMHPIWASSVLSYAVTERVVRSVHAALAERLPEELVDHVLSFHRIAPFRICV